MGRQEKPQAGMNRAGMQRRDKPSARPLALPGPPGEGRGQKARNCQEFSGEKDSTAEGDESQGDFTQVKARRG